MSGLITFKMDFNSRVIYLFLLKILFIIIKYIFSILFDIVIIIPNFII